MPDGSFGRENGRIGPNAILQLVPVLDRAVGRKERDRILAMGGVFDLPSDQEMMPEVPAALVHQAMRSELLDMAPALAAEAGRGTARYILAHRIPQPVQSVLKLLPAWIAAPILSRAIAKHAWTFAGSGRFRRLGAWTFEIAANPIVAGEVAAHPLCHWHAAVFETLYQTLVHARSECRETTCCAAGAPACRFEISGG